MNLLQKRHRFTPDWLCVAKRKRRRSSKNSVPVQMAMPLLFLALIDIYATVSIAFGSIPPWVPLLCGSAWIGVLMGRTTLNRVLSLGTGAVVVVCTSAGIGVSFWLGNGFMSPETGLALRNYFALHCSAIMVGHLLAMILFSGVRIGRRPLQQLQS